MSNEINQRKKRINKKALEPSEWLGRSNNGRRDGRGPDLSKLSQLTSRAQERLEQKHEALNQLTLQAEAASQAAANIEAYLRTNLPEDLAFAAAFSITISEEDVKNLRNLAEAVEALIKSEQPTLEEVSELKKQIDHDPELRALIAPILSAQEPRAKEAANHQQEQPASQPSTPLQKEASLIDQFLQRLLTAENPETVAQELKDGELRKLLETIVGESEAGLDTVRPEKRRSTTFLAALAGAGISLAVITSACAHPDQQAFATVPPVQPTPVESTPDPTQKPTAETEPTNTPEPTPQYFAAGGNEIAPTLSETQLEKALSDATKLVNEGVEKNYFLKDNVQVKIYVLDLANPESDYRIALESTAEVEGSFPAGTIFVKHNGELRPLQNPENTTVAHSIELNRWTALDEESQPVLILADNGYLVPNPQLMERFKQTDEQQLAAVLKLAKKGVNWQAPKVEMITVTVEGRQLVLAVDPREGSAVGRGIWGAWAGEPGEEQPGEQPGQAMFLGSLPEDYKPTHEIKVTVEEGELRAEAREKQLAPEYKIGVENLTNELKEANNFKEEQRPISNGEVQIRVLRHQSLTENLPFEFNHEVITEQEFVNAIVERWTATQASMFNQDEQVYINAIDWGWILEEKDSLENNPRLPRANITNPKTGQRRMDWLIEPFPYSIDKFDHITMIEMPARFVPDRIFPREERSILGPDGELLQVGLITRGDPELSAYFGTIVNHRPDGEKELVVISFQAEYGKENSPIKIPPINIETDDKAYYNLVGRIGQHYNYVNHNIRFSCLDESIYKREASRLAMSDVNGQITISLLQKYGEALFKDGTFNLRFFGLDEFPISKHLFVFDTD